VQARTKTWSYSYTKRQDNTQTDIKCLVVKVSLLRLQGTKLLSVFTEVLRSLVELGLTTADNENVDGQQPGSFHQWQGIPQMEAIHT